MKRPNRSSAKVVLVLLTVRHPLALRHVQSLLRQEKDLVLQSELIQRTRGPTPPPAVVILDAESVSSDFGRYLLNLRAQVPEAKILVLGNDLSDTEICQLLLYGVHGFINYNHVDKDLALGVRKLSKGHLMVPQRILEQFAQYASSMAQRTGSSKFAITPKERTTLSFLHRGLSNKEIAAAMRISQRTVKFHLSNVFSKLGVHDRHSLTDMLRTAMLTNAPTKKPDRTSGEEMPPTK